MGTDHAQQTEHGGPCVDIDVAFELLVNRETRTVIAFFMEAETKTATVDELATQCLQVNEGDRKPEVTDPIRNRLYHIVLPKLADADVIEYDTRNQTVRYHKSALLETLVECVRDFDS